MSAKWLRRYVRLVIGAGVLTIAYSLISLYTTSHRWEWLLLAALAVATGSFSMKLGTVYASITVSDTFFICTALLFGPAPATLASALSTAVSSTRRRHRREQTAFNVSTTAIGMFGGSQVFYLLSGVAPLIAGQTPVEQIILPLTALAAVYFILNSGIVAVAVGLDTGKSAIGVWRKHFSWLSVNCFAAASVSFCLLLLNDKVSFAAVLVVLPLLAVLHLTLSSSFGRLDDASKHVQHLDRLYLSTVETLAMAIDAKDDVTHSHVRRVQAYALGLARALGVTDGPTLKGIEAAALLHDTGKLAVPEHILNKPGKLSEAEFEQMKRHVDVGADILSLVDFPYPVVPIVRCHHENWDGTGYPRGVAGPDIPIGARILSVVDCFDALTSDRPYRSALSTDAAFDILRARRGTMYEPLVVDTFIRVHRDLVNQMESFPAHDALRQITRSAAGPGPAPAQLVVTPEGVSDDILAFVSLARLASGDASMGDVLSLASGLMRDLSPASTIGWFIVDESSGYLAMRHASGPAAAQVSGTALRLGEGMSGWVAANRQVMINSEASLDLGEKAHSGLRLTHALSAPLMARESLVGTITLYAECPFTESQSRLVQVIAPHLAQAIWSAKRNEAASHAQGARTTAGGNSDLRLVSTR
jgi:putative nucleotidyltransferase with HDIG domain